MRTVVDGFNLFYGLLKGTPYKWLDLHAFCSKLLPKSYDIRKIKYYTALVNNRPNKPDTKEKQNAYLRALQASGVEVIKGRYTEQPKPGPLVSPNSPLVKRIRGFSKVNKRLFESDDNWTEDPGPIVHVINSEEKGTDVNLAVDIVNDAWRDEYDCCALISNDTDMARALKIVTRELQKKVIIIHARRGRKSPPAILKKYASDVKRVWEGVEKASQFPDSIPGTKIHKPEDW